MTFPGVQGIKGPGWLSTIGFQVRQSRVQPYAGGTGLSAIYAMGSNAPAWGVTALAVNAKEESTDTPHPIEQEDFEQPLFRGGTQQFGVDPTNPSAFIDAADPAEHDKPNYTGQ